MKQYEIETTYLANTTGRVTFPVGKTWADVHSWYLKWDMLFCRFKGTDNYVAIEIDSDPVNVIGWGRPINAKVFLVDEDGCTDYNVLLDEQGD